MANKVENFTKKAALISGHPVQKSIAIHFHPCNPLLVPQNTCSVMFRGIFYRIYSCIWWHLAIQCGIRKQ